MSSTAVLDRPRSFPSFTAQRGTLRHRDLFIDVLRVTAIATIVALHWLMPVLSYDGPQQRLVRLTMDLEAAQRRLDDDPAAARPLVEEALRQTQEALAELRALSRGIAPPILADRGLPAALAAAAARCPVPVELDVALGGTDRPTASAENAAYFVVAEALTNVAKHSGASSATVLVARADGVLHVQVSDDGIGGAHLGKGHGLAGLSDRLAGIDGNLEVHSPPGGGTVLTADIPVV